MAALAERLEMTPQAIYKWERGSQPRAEALPALAEALGVPSAYFFREDAQSTDAPTFFRSRTSATKSARRGATARLQWLSEIVTELERHVDLPAVALPEIAFPDPREATTEDVEMAAAIARQFFALGSGPVPNLVMLLEASGVVVSRTSLGEWKLDAFSTWVANGRPVVFLNADKKAAVRSRFDAAHELGHLLMHRGRLHRDFLEDKELFNRLEEQANRFAGALLLPRDGLMRDVRVYTIAGLLAAKPRWGTSVQALLSRSQALRLIEPQSAKWQWVQLSRRGWRSGEPLDDVLAPEVPSLLRRAFEVLHAAGVRPERELVIPAEEIEALCALPPGYLSPPSAAPRVVLKGKEDPHQR